jgi:hypothetical protein
LVASDADPNCREGPAAAVSGQPLGLESETIPGALIRPFEGQMPMFGRIG